MALITKLAHWTDRNDTHTITNKGLKSRSFNVYLIPISDEFKGMQNSDTLRPNKWRVVNGREDFFFNSSFFLISAKKALGLIQCRKSFHFSTLDFVELEWTFSYQFSSTLKATSTHYLSFSFECHLTANPFFPWTMTWAACYFCWIFGSK